MRAYCPHFGEVLAGCALRTNAGVLVAGSAIGTWSGFGAVSPLEAALASFGGHGLGPEDIANVVWVAGSSSAEVRR